GTTIQKVISTHALREEGDVFVTPCNGERGQFLPTPSARRATYYGVRLDDFRQFLPTPSARRATYITCKRADGSQFLPTPSARRATTGAELLVSSVQNFYPRPPRGGRLPGRMCRFLSSFISTHALREEGDPILR